MFLTFVCKKNVLKVKKKNNLRPLVFAQPSNLNDNSKFKGGYPAEGPIVFTDCENNVQ